MLETTFFEEIFCWVVHPKGVRITLTDVTEGDAIFVTGKLMDPEFVRNVTGRYIPFTAAVARNYARGERGRGKKKILLLESRPGGIVIGVLLLKLTRSDMDALDRFEQIPQLRHRSTIRVTVGALERDAVTFLLNE